MSERLEPGSIIDARYRVDHRLGAGGMAEVYCAEDLQLGRKVALKVLYRRFAEDEEFVERFRREASSAAGLQHQHVVAVYDRGEYDGTYYIAMEYLEGRSLKKLITDEAPLDPERAVDLIVQILRAARFAHRRGIIHRDLKPHNVIVDDEDRAKVTDFGIARAGASDMTQTGSIMGTAQYLSPEQAQGLPVSDRSDLYSIGVMLYEMLTGRLPFDGESAVSIALKHVSEMPEPPSTYNRAISPALEAVVMRAMAKAPANRFPDADTFIAALEAALVDPDTAAALPSDITQFVGRTGAPVAPPLVGEVVAAYDSAVYPAPLVPPPDEDREGRWWLWLVGLVVVVGIVVAGAILLSGGKKITVQNVVGTHLAAAEVTLQDQGFSTDDITEPSPSQAEGIVIGQRPSGGAKLGKGDTVHLVVSSGPATAVVPPLSGEKRNSARKQLKQAGFTDVVLTYKYDANVVTNHVIGTDPRSGTTVSTAQLLSLIISRGTQRVPVPDETGKTQSEAIHDLQNAGLKYTLAQMASSEAPGTVLSQSPKGPTPVPKGTVVTLTVASEVSVPDVTGLTQFTARTQLKNAGYAVVVETTDVSDKGQNLRVQSQSPDAGTMVRKGAQITITIGKYVAPPPPTATTTTPAPPPPGTTTTPTPTPTTP
jgi:beta-lactam-binding protein with PASTA domain/tRNA A-37 threonylcarbamoyl transferase component Bud32